VSDLARCRAARRSARPGSIRRVCGKRQTAWPEVRRISGLISFEPDKIPVHLDGTRLRLEPGQTVIPHGPDRDLTTDEVTPGRRP